MSIELPEVTILAKQMNEVLIGKKIVRYKLQDYERLQKIGFINKQISDFDQLRGQTISSISCRGNTIIIKLEFDINLVLAPEYGGTLLYHPNLSKIPKKIHLVLQFSDETAFSVRMRSMGCINVVEESKLKDNYMYKRDYSNLLSPTEKEFVSIF